MAKRGNGMDWNALKGLIGCHGTSGEEDEVAAFLMSMWKDCGWNVETFGRYGVVASRPKEPTRPTLLLAAHMDSPGFIVESTCGSTSYAINIGGIPCHELEPDETIPLMARTAQGHRPAVLTQILHEESHTRYVVQGEGLQRGDRLCYAPQFILSDGLIRAPFLDNRFGCFMLCELSREFAQTDGLVNLVLAATAGEEFTGFGAAVLAHHCQADMTLCMDATYVNGDQGVLMYGGPVMTCTDKSVTLGRRQWRFWETWAERQDIPLQKEIYNYSGTDAVGFPRAGQSCPVLPLLLPTCGNHSCSESAAIHDMLLFKKLLMALCNDAAAVVGFAELGFETNGIL